MVLDQPHELIQGGIVYDSQVSTDTPWVFRTMANGFDLGHAVPLLEVVQSLLTDGEYVTVTSHGNREVSFRLRVSANDGQALAQAEALLATEKISKRPSPLVWTPPSMDAWPCVFDVVHMDVTADFSDGWDHKERFSCNRYYLVTLTCLPWVRDLEPTVIEALPVPENPDEPATYNVIDECDSAAGWTSIRCHNSEWTNPAITTGLIETNTFVRAASTLTSVTHGGEQSMGLVRPGAVSLGGLRYLTVDAATTSTYAGAVSSGIVVVVAGIGYRPVAVSPRPLGISRYYFEVPDAFTGIQIRGSWAFGGLVLVGHTVSVFELGAIDRIEVEDSNGFQLARTATVGGSAPTQAAITFGTTLGPLLGSSALIYTGSSAVVPLRNYRVDSAVVVTDPTMISGSYNDLSEPMVFRIPVALLADSTYTLPARMNYLTTAAINWSARIVDADGGAIPGSEIVVSGTTSATNATAAPWMIHALAAIQLPVVKIEGDSTHAVELTISMTAGGAGVDFDEGWLCDTDNGAVTTIHEPSVFELTRIELRSPQLDALEQSVSGSWIDHGTQDITRLVTSLGTHLISPGLMHVFTASDRAKYAQCALKYFRRYLNFAGPDLPSEDGLTPPAEP